MHVEDIAAICHDANRRLCSVNGDLSQELWHMAAPWQQESAINGVRFALANPDAPPSAQHDAWMREKVAAGWVHGPVKDASATPPCHPCLVPYDQLPPHQRAKDHLFKAIVNALTPFVTGDEGSPRATSQQT